VNEPEEAYRDPAKLYNPMGLTFYSDGVVMVHSHGESDESCFTASRSVKYMDSIRKISCPKFNHGLHD